MKHTHSNPQQTLFSSRGEQTAKNILDHPHCDVSTETKVVRVAIEAANEFNFTFQGDVQHFIHEMLTQG